MPFLAFPAFLAGWDIRELALRMENFRENLGSHLGVNGRQKRLFVDTVDKSMILMIISIHEGFRK
jgi:hypothetical protein